LTGYYRGFLAPLLATGTLNAIFFGAYADICEYLVNVRTKNKTTDGILSKTSDFNKQPNFESFYSQQAIVTRGPEKDERKVWKVETLNAQTVVRVPTL